MSTCTQSTRGPLARKGEPPVQCVREVDDQGRHVGQHQGFEEVPPISPDSIPTWSKPSDLALSGYTRIVTWDLGGSRSSAYVLDDPANNCSCKSGKSWVKHQPDDHIWRTCEGCRIIFNSTGVATCHSCGYWEHRVRDFEKVGRKGERFVRPHGDSMAHEPWLYVWSPGRGGAFGGAQYRVTFDDGTVVGPADYLWSNGRIPWWLVDQFPPNATVEYVDKIRRPGHTTGSNGSGSPMTYTGHPN